MTSPSIILFNTEFTYKPYPRATFRSIYGVGHTRANKLDALMLHHPSDKEFSVDLVALSHRPLYRKMFTNMMVSHRLKLSVFHRLQRLSTNGCYKAVRFFQNLPAHGQRTHANAGTPSAPYNPLTRLGLEPSYVSQCYASFKSRELFINGREKEAEEARIPPKRLNKNKSKTKPSAKAVAKARAKAKVKARNKTKA